MDIKRSLKYGGWALAERTISHVGAPIATVLYTLGDKGKGLVNTLQTGFDNVGTGAYSLAVLNEAVKDAQGMTHFGRIIDSVKDLVTGTPAAAEAINNLSDIVDNVQATDPSVWLLGGTIVAAGLCSHKIRNYLKNRKRE